MPCFLAEVVGRGLDLSPSQTHQTFFSEELHLRLTGSSLRLPGMSQHSALTSLTLRLHVFRGQVL